MLDLAQQDLGLDLVQPAVHAVDHRDPARLGALAVRAQHPHPLGQLRVVGDDRARVAERAEVLRRIEAVRGQLAPSLALVLGAVRLRRVLEDRQRRARAAARRRRTGRRGEQGTIARVRSVTAARADAGSSVHVAGSTSASTGGRSGAAIPVTVATHVFAAVITSSPGPTPSARSASSIASVPELTPTA